MNRNQLRILCLVSGLAVAVIGFSAAAASAAHRAERRQAEVQYAALTDTVGRLETLADSLARTVADAEPLPALIAMRHDADLASASLDRLALTGEGGEALRRFVLCCSAIGGGMADDLARGLSRVPDYALLIRLRDCASVLVGDVFPSALRAGGVDEDALAAHFSTLGRLYYDGIGSDVQPQSGYSALQRGDRLDASAAREAAAEIVRGAYLTLRDTEGEPERYCFTAENISLTLSAVNGRLLSFLCDRRSNGTGELIGEGEARAAAERMIGDYVPTPLELIGQEAGEGCYYFCFAPFRDGVLCLSERILVGIDGVSGRLSLWDADRFYRYHSPVCTLPEIMLTPEEAALRYGDGVSSVTLCTAVRGDGRELLCYRLGEGEDAVYLNAVTGRLEETA